MIGVKPWNNYNLIVWAAGQKYDFHSHPHFQAIQVLDGRLEVDYGEGWKAIAPGYVHILPPGRSHRLKTSAGHRQFGLNFTTKPDKMGLVDAMRTAFPVPAIHSMGFHVSWLESLKADAVILGNVARLRMLNTLMDWTVGLIGSKLESKSDPEAMRLARILETWNRRSINVTDAAKQINCSRPKAQRICNRRFGCGIMKLHEKMRMEEASRLLLNSGLSIGKVADACGFEDIYSFSRAFTRVVGLSPSAFRRKTKEG
ncbi:MAG: helix-turn-helix domain-containing protein [Kiritimatiellae bacterium]|nr:helix-turn-helix domain-containing protein [Kiritimatiellia bacterium]